MSKAAVKVGQVWKDRDWRVKDRFLRVVFIDSTHATMQRCNQHGASLTHNTTRVALKRFRPTSTGYDLIAEAR